VDSACVYGRNNRLVQGSAGIKFTNNPQDPGVEGTQQSAVANASE